MFVYSIRASTIKFFAVIAVTVAVLVGLLAFGGSGDYVTASTGSVDLTGMKENSDRVKFISSFGFSVKEDPIESESFAVPDNFDRIIAGYNEIQKLQGLDISKYKNKRVTRYTYEIENYEDGKSAYVNLVIYKNTVIACDISSTEPGGFVKPLFTI